MSDIFESEEFSMIDPALAAIGSGDVSQGDPFDLLGLKAEERAIDRQDAQNVLERQLQAEAKAQARTDALRLTPAAEQNRLMGAQRGLDILGQSIPQQFSTFQQGNVGAQQQQIGGLSQIQNALLGLPVDTSGFQPQTLDFDTSFAQQQLPEFISTTQALGLNPDGTEIQQPDLTAENQAFEVWKSQFGENTLRHLLTNTDAEANFRAKFKRDNQQNPLSGI